MQPDSNRHRRSTRLRGFDYSEPGAYFITLVTRGREYLFGDIHDGEMRLSDAGKIIWEVWNSLPVRYPHIELGTAVVMPNHFHGVIIINEMGGGNYVGAIHELPLREKNELPKREVSELPLQAVNQLTAQERRMHRRRMTLPLVVGYFKTNSAKHINKILGSEGIPVWQRNYYEHIIRDDEDHNRIHLYIEANTANWESDEENPLYAG